MQSKVSMHRLLGEATEVHFQYSNVLKLCNEKLVSSLLPIIASTVAWESGEFSTVAFQNSGSALPRLPHKKRKKLAKGSGMGLATLLLYEHFTNATAIVSPSVKACDN